MNKCSKEFISHEQMCLPPLPTLLIASLLISQNASKHRGNRAQSCHSSLVLLVAVAVAAEAGQTVGAYARGEEGGGESQVKQRFLKKNSKQVKSRPLGGG